LGRVTGATFRQRSSRLRSASVDLSRGMGPLLDEYRLGRARPLRPLAERGGDPLGWTTRLAVVISLGLRLLSSSMPFTPKVQQRKPSLWSYRRPLAGRAQLRLRRAEDENGVPNTAEAEARRVEAVLIRRIDYLTNARSQMGDRNPGANSSTRLPLSSRVMLTSIDESRPQIVRGGSGP
jgi:hypothetical protein